MKLETSTFGCSDGQCVYRHHNLLLNFNPAPKLYGYYLNQNETKIIFNIRRNRKHSNQFAAVWISGSSQLVLVFLQPTLAVPAGLCWQTGNSIHLFIQSIEIWTVIHSYSLSTDAELWPSSFVFIFTLWHQSEVHHWPFGKEMCQSFVSSYIMCEILTELLVWDTRNIKVRFMHNLRHYINQNWTDEQRFS